MSPESESQDNFDASRGFHNEIKPGDSESFDAQIEKGESLEQSELLEAYQQKNLVLKNKISDLQKSELDLKSRLEDVRTKLYEGNLPESISNPSLEQIEKELQKLQGEKIAVSSNYPGDWTLLLRDRMLDPITKEKFVQTREDAMPHMKQGDLPKSDGLSFVKPKEYASHYQKQIDEYDKNVSRIFSKTNTGLAKDFNKDESKLGSGSIGEIGNVFLDAQKEGKDLSIRHKNIIESHEKGHGLRDFVATDQQDFRHSIDFSIIEQSDDETGKRERGYLRQADEIAERMAQLKNYFGLKASNTFTKEHLAYAKEHYVEDIELDNNMSTFLNAVTENTTSKFIETINKYPL